VVKVQIEDKNLDKANSSVRGGTESGGSLRTKMAELPKDINPYGVLGLFYCCHLSCMDCKDSVGNIQR
jgi:hypothetical protein